MVPRTISENSGLNATDVVAGLAAAHAAGDAAAGVDIETGEPRCRPAPSVPPMLLTDEAVAPWSVLQTRLGLCSQAALAQGMDRARQ